MTARIYLRPFKAEDATTLLKWGQDKYYHQLAGFDHYQNLTQAEIAAGQYAARKYSYGVCLEKTHKLIGLVELYDRGTNEAELLTSKEVGFLLDKEFSGHGYMTEALTLLFNFAFNKLKQEQIWAGTFTNNERSQRLLRNLGFKFINAVDLSKISNLFSYEEKYYLLKRADWINLN